MAMQSLCFPWVHSRDLLLNQFNSIIQGKKSLEVYFAHFIGELNEVVMDGRAYKDGWLGRGAGMGDLTLSVVIVCQRVQIWGRRGWNAQVICPCGFRGGRNGVTKVAAMVQQQCFCNFLSSAVSWLEHAVVVTDYLKIHQPISQTSSPFIPLFLSTLDLFFYIIVWNVKKENTVSSGFMVPLGSQNSGSYSGP